MFFRVTKAVIHRAPLYICKGFCQLKEYKCIKKKSSHFFSLVTWLGLTNLKTLDSIWQNQNNWHSWTWTQGLMTSHLSRASGNDYFHNQSKKKVEKCQKTVAHYFPRFPTAQSDVLNCLFYPHQSLHFLSFPEWTNIPATRTQQVSTWFPRSTLSEPIWQHPVKLQERTVTTSRYWAPVGKKQCQRSLCSHIKN